MPLSPELQPIRDRRREQARRLAGGMAGGQADLPLQPLGRDRIRSGVIGPLAEDRMMRAALDLFRTFCMVLAAIVAIGAWLQPADPPALVWSMRIGLPTVAV